MVLSLRDGKKKMLFYLTTLNLAKFLYENAPNLKKNEKDKQVVVVVEAVRNLERFLMGMDRNCKEIDINYKEIDLIRDSHPP